jgi:CheY-like chemotaxis protein
VCKILLVDDDILVRRVTRRFLERAGHVVVEAADGEAGLGQLEDQCPDLVLTDILMPRMNGLEMMVEMRRRCPGIPLIAMTGGGRPGVGDDPVLLLARDMGAARTFTKPVDMLALLSAIEDLTTR